MKKYAKKFLTLCLTGAMLTGLMSPALAAKSQTIPNDAGRKLIFTDVASDEIGTDETAFYKDVVTANDTYLHWVNLAYLIHESTPHSFRDNADDGWDEDFGGGNDEYPDYIQDMMNSRYERETSHGVSSSGISVAYSLKDVQQRAADDLAAIITRDVTGDDFMDQHEIEMLTETSQPVIYSTVVMKDKEGISQKFHYNAFGIAFYDFQIHPLSSEDAMSGSVSTESNSAEDGMIVLNQNNSYDDATATVALSESVSETTSASITNSESYSFGQSIGGSVNLGTLGEIGPRFTLSAQLSFGEVIETAYSEENSITNSVEKSSSVTMTVPAHTVVTGTQTTSTAKQTTTFDCPVGITYRVAIFSMSGALYDDGIGITSFDGYDQNSFVTLFGSDLDVTDAVENLYQRANKHESDSSYEETYGSTLDVEKDGTVRTKKLSWSAILGKDAPDTNGSYTVYGGRDLLAKMEAAYPMSEDGASISIVQDSVSTVLDTAQPTLPIASTYINWQLNRAFEMEVGEALAISSYRVKAVDKDAVPYYGFVPTWGTWKIVNSEGKETNSTIAEMEYNAVTGEQKLIAKSPGTTYVKYFIPEDTYYTYHGVVSSNANISSGAYKVEISAASGETPAAALTSIEATGAVNVLVGETMNLNVDAEKLTVTAYDANGAEMEDVSVSWEAKETTGITVKADGSLSASTSGAYHVRAYCDDVYSDWIKVTATDPVSLVQYVCNHPFTDVAHGAWYEPAVEYVYQNNVMNGVKDARFSPGQTTTRAMVAQILYNLEGRPFAVDETRFADVSDDAWYADAVAWAAANGLTTGVKADRFAPNGEVSREQMVTFLCRYAEWKGLDLDQNSVDLSKYQDADQISGWAKDFVVQGLEAGIIQGKSDAKLAPQGTATRAELAQVLRNLLAE